MKPRERSNSINWNAAGTIISLIAAVVSAGAAIYSNGISEKLTHSDVIVNRQSSSILSQQLCYRSPGGSGTGLGTEGFWLYNTVKTSVTLTNKGGQPVSILNLFAEDDLVAQGRSGHHFNGTILESGSEALGLTHTTMALAVGESHVVLLVGNEQRPLGSTEAEAQTALASELVSTPSSITWRIDLGDLKTLTIPATIPEPIQAVPLVVDKSLDCTNLPRN